MVQNWENFMSPSGGSTDVGIMNDPLTSLAAGVAIDMFMRPEIEKIASPDRAAIGRRFYGVGTSRKGGVQQYRSYGRGGRLTGPRLFGEPSRVVGQTIPGVGKIGTDGKFKTKIYPEGRQGRVEMRKDLNKYVKQVEGRFKKIYAGRVAGTARLLRGASWMLLASGFATMAESLAMPGLTKSAEQSNAMAMGDTGPLDSQQAYTQRQRALMAIHDSQLGLRNVIGNEAGHFHR